MNTLRSLMAGILMLVALITVPVTALAAFDTTQTGLVGLWHMDNDWKDASVVGNNGTPYSGVSFSTNAKVGAYAGSFNGVNNFVGMGSPASLKMTTAMSFSAWIYPTGPGSLATYGGIIVNKEGEYEIARFVDGSIQFAIANTSPGWNWINTKYIAPLNTWTHIVLTYSASNNQLYAYANGLLVYQGFGIGNIGDFDTNNNDFRIGGRQLTSNYFQGIIDEAAIYNRDLSATEIQELYRNNVVKSPTMNPVTSPTATPNITLSGTKPANTAIVVNGNTLVPLNGATTWQTTYNLFQGTNNLTITALDSQNFNSLPATLTVVLDATPPQVTVTTPANNGTLRAAPSAVTFAMADDLSPLDYTATLNGASVTNASGFNVSGIWSSSGSGSTGTVTFTPSSTLTEGAYTATIKPADKSGNVITSSVTFTIDSIPPVAPEIDPATAPINTTSKTITGTKSSDSASVAVSCAGATIGTISYPTTTTWSVDVSGLEEGNNTIAAYAVDTAGNPSSTATAAITVDTTPPVVGATPAGGIFNSTQSVALAANTSAVIYYTTDGSTPTVSATMYSQPISIPVTATLKYFARDLAGNNSEVITENYVIDTIPPVLAISTLSDGVYTNNEILNIAGTVTDTTGVIGVTVNDTAVQVNADGSFSHALLLKNGVNILTIAATDNTGNKTADIRTVTLDQTAPIVAVTTPADNSKTGKLLLEVSGTVDETSTVTVRMKDIVQSAVMNDGAFTATIILEPGYNTIEITATDLAGNQSSLKRTVVFDDQLPSLALTMPNQDIRTNLNILTVKGTVHDAFTAVDVKIIKDNEIFTPPVIDGTFEQTLNFTEEKTYGIVLTATNEVGTSASVQRNVIYDITPPALSIDPVTSPTGQPGLSVAGTREAGTAVTVACATAIMGEVSYPTATTWLVDVSGLTEGENVITAASVDAAGNAVTATATIVLASRPPEITIKATPNVIWPPNRQMVPVTIAGGVEAYGSDIKSVSISVSDEYGKYEYKNLTFGSTVMLEAWRDGNDADGRKYTITAVVTNKGGIKTAKAVTVTVPHDNVKLKKFFYKPLVRHKKSH